MRVYDVESRPVSICMRATNNVNIELKKHMRLNNKRIHVPEDVKAKGYICFFIQILFERFSFYHSIRIWIQLLREQMRYILLIKHQK